MLAFTMHGASGAIACSALCAGKGEYPALNRAAQQSPPSPAEEMQLMVKAARARLDKQRGLARRAGGARIRPLPSARWRARAQRAARLRRRPALATPDAANYGRADALPPI